MKTFFCQHGNILNLNLIIQGIVSYIENQAGFVLNTSWGWRCFKCNKKAGGSPRSAHLRGNAIDITFKNSRELFILLSIIMALRIRKRIGINFKRRIRGWN